MLLILSLLVASNIIFIGILYSKILQNKNLFNRIKEQENLENTNIELQKQINNLKIIEGEKNFLSKNVVDKEEEIKKKQIEIDRLRNDFYLIEKRSELVLQEKSQLDKEKQEWEGQKNKLLKELSYSIIEENIKQNNIVQSKNKKEIEDITKKLFDSFGGVLEKVSTLNTNNEYTKNELDIIKKGLLNPTGAGLTSETTLSNILKSSNLKEKTKKDGDGDYILQTSFNTDTREENTKRPDAIIYLPNNNYIIVDSKSSMHFLELQQAIDSKNEILIKEIKKKIKDRMNKHLQDLKEKDYEKAQLEYLNISNARNSSILTVMFLQTEKMLEIIREIDIEFENKCFNQNIYPLTPIGLINLLNTARCTIQKEKQNLNFDILKDELRKLFDNVGNLFLHSKSLGKSLEKSIGEYNEFANIFNKKILLRFKNMEKIGIENIKRDFSKSKLETYQIFSETLNTIDSEADEIEHNLLTSNEIEE